MLKRAKIDLSRLNPGRVTILVNRVENARPFAESFEAQGYHVEIATDPSKLYNALCGGDAPGMVLISDQIATPMAKMMPDFVVNRFKIPVILFQEDAAVAAPDLSRRNFAAEVLPVGLVTPNDLVDAVKNFEQVYEQRLLDGADNSKAVSKGLVSVSAPPPVAAVTEEKAVSFSSEEFLKQMQQMCEPSSIVIGRTDVVTLHAGRINHPSGKGFFVFAFPVRESALDPALAMKRIEERMRATGLVGLEIDRLEPSVPGLFFGDLEQHSDEVISGLVENQEMILLFFRNRNEIEEPEARISGENFLVPMEEWWTRLPLPCHAYVWLELNQRRILYVRPGACLRTEAFARLSQHGVNHLALDPADFGDYRKIRELVRIAYAPTIVGTVAA